MNQFSEKYKTLSNAALLAIIAKPADYQESALEAAQNELDERKLSEDELTEARLENEILLRKEQDLTEARQAAKNKVRSWGVKFADIIDPFGIGGLSADLIIKRLCIIMALIWIYDVYVRLSLLKCLFLDGLCGWSINVCASMLPVVVLPLSIMLLWYRKKAGWVLLTAFYIYTVVATVHILYIDIRIMSSSTPSAALMESLLLSYIGNIVLYSFLSLMICKKDIRELYTVNWNTWTVVFLVAFAFLGLQRIY